MNMNCRFPYHDDKAEVNIVEGKDGPINYVNVQKMVEM